MMQPKPETKSARSDFMIQPTMKTKAMAYASKNRLSYSQFVCIAIEQALYRQILSANKPKITILIYPDGSFEITEKPSWIDVEFEEVIEDEDTNN